MWSIGRGGTSHRSLQFGECLIVEFNDVLEIVCRPARAKRKGSNHAILDANLCEIERHRIATLLVGLLLLMWTVVGCLFQSIGREAERTERDDLKRRVRK